MNYIWNVDVIDTLWDLMVELAGKAGKLVGATPYEVIAFWGVTQGLVTPDEVMTEIVVCG